MSLVSRWAQSISRASRDGMALSRAVYGAVRPGNESATEKHRQPTTLATTTSASIGETIKSVLLQEARREPIPNTLAIFVLKIDKEVGLVRYWGLAEYLKQNQPAAFSFASLSKADNGNGDVDTIDGGASQRPAIATAKVAFMITSSMKRDLVDGLGYQASVVRAMTPQQASLVLHHRLVPDSYEDSISELEEAFAEEQEQLMNQRITASMEDSEEKSAPKSQQSFEKTAAIRDDDGHSDSSMRSSSSAEDSSNSDVPLMLSSSSSRASQETSPPPTPSIGEIDSDDLWYEVVEVKEEGSEMNEIRHGLYKDHEEALLGLETRQDIESKREHEAQNNKYSNSNINSIENGADKQAKFVLRPVSIKDL